MCRRMKLKLHFSLSTKLNTKWIMDLNVRPNSLTLIVELISNVLVLIGTGKNFLDSMLLTQALRIAINK